MSAFTDVVDTIEGIILDLAESPWILLVLLAVCIIDAFFPPIPSESVVVALAALAVTGSGPPLWVIGILAAAGAWIGDNITYAIGRRVGVERWAWLRAGRASRAVELARRSIARRAVLFLMTARFIPGGRTAVNFTAGATGYPRRTFVRISAAAAAVWAAYSVGIGSVFGHVFADQPLLAAGLGIVVAVAIGLIVDRIISWRRAPRPAPEHELHAAGERAGS
jgi:membrane protein DedA with SNARE-associated domain